MGKVQGWNSYVGFGNQAALATAVTPTKYQHCDYGVNLAEIRTGRSVVPGIIKSREFKTSRKSQISVAGSIPMVLRPDDYAGGRFWASLGMVNTVAGDADLGYTHSFTEAGTKATLPLYGETIEVYKGGADTNTLAKYIGMFVKRAVLNIPEEGVVMLNTDWVGVKETLTGTVQTPSYTTVAPFESWMLKVEVGASLAALSAINVKDLTIDWDTMVTLGHQHNGSSQYPTYVSWDIPVIKISFNKVLEDDYGTYYNYFKNDTENAVQITLTHTVLSGNNAGSEYEYIFKFPRVVWTGGTPAVDNEGALNLPLTFQAMEEQSSYNYTVNFSIKNSESGTYAIS